MRISTVLRAAPEPQEWGEGGEAGAGGACVLPAVHSWGAPTPVSTLGEMFTITISISTTTNTTTIKFATTISTTITISTIRTTIFNLSKNFNVSLKGC